MLELINRKKEKPKNPNLRDRVKGIVEHDREIGTRGLEPRLSALMARHFPGAMPASEYRRIGNVNLGTSGTKVRRG